MFCFIFILFLCAVPLYDAVSLSDDAVQFAARLLFSFLAVTDSACRVFNNSTRGSCGYLFIAMVDHASGCAKAARNNRQNSFRDWWLSVVKEASGRALHDQVVHDYARHRRQRSDGRASY